MNDTVTTGRLAAPIRFLVVEDKQAQLDATAGLLKALGAADVVGVTSGAAALRCLRDPEFETQIMMLDVAMPDMDGIEVLQALRSSRQDHAPVALIIHTACAPELLDTIELLANEYHPHVLGTVAKPLTASKLEPLLERWEAANAASSSAGRPGLA